MNKVLILFFALFAICLASSVDIKEIATKITHADQKVNEARAAFQQLSGMMIERHDNLQAAHKRAMKKAVTPQCAAALLGFVALNADTTCAGYVLAAVNINATSDSRIQGLDGFCNTCLPKYKNVVQNVTNSCSRADIDPSTLGLAVFYLKFLCSKDGSGKYCANVLFSVANQVSSDYTKWTTSTLDNLCSDCTRIAIRVLSQTAGGSDIGGRVLALSLRGLCVKYRGDYCVLKFKDLKQRLDKVIQTVVTGGQPSQDDFQAFLNVMCYPCFRLFIARIALVSPDLNLSEISQLGLMCRKNQGGEFCLLKLYNALKTYLGGPGSSDIPCDARNTTCSADCSNLVKKLIADGGCCWGILLDVVSGSQPGTDSPAKTQVREYLKNCAGGTVPDPCPSIATGTFTITYKGLLTSYVNDNKAAFILAVLADLNSTIGGYEKLDQTQVTVTTSAKRDGDVTVVVPGVGVTGTNAGVLTVQVDDCQSVCQNYPASSQSTDVTVSSRSSNVAVTSSSTIVSVSFALLAVVALFFF